MMRYRHRLGTLALVGLLAVTGLVACRSDPTVAAYVGDARITEQRVADVVDGLRATFEGELEAELEQLAPQGESAGDRREQGQQRVEEQLVDARQRVLTMLVVSEAGKRYAEAEGVQVPAAPTAEAAQSLSLPEDHPYVRVFAEYVTVLNALQPEATPTDPTTADQREVYENLTLQGEPLAVPFEQVQPALTAEVLATPVGVRDLLTTVMEQADIKVQPGYEVTHQVQVQVGGATSFLAVPISEPSQVVDVE